MSDRVTAERPRRSRTFRLALAGVLGFPLGFLLVVSAVALGFGPAAPLGALVLLASTALLGFLVLRWLARRLFYGVGRRLLVSYLLVGVVPPFLLAGFALVILYVLAGQLAALRVEAALVERVNALQTWAEALKPTELASAGPPAAAELLADAGEISVAWRIAGGASGSAGPVPLAELLPERVDGGGIEGFGRAPDGRLLLFALAASEAGMVLAAQDLEPQVRKAVEAATRVAVVFPQSGLSEGSGDVTFNYDGRAMRTVTESDAPGQEAVVRENPFADTAAPPGGRGPLQATWVFWGRSASPPWVALPSLEPVAWDDDDSEADSAGEAPEPGQEGFLLFVRTSIAREYFALFGGLRGTGINEEVGEGALAVIRVLLVVTVVASLLIALLAAFLVQRVAVATARLSRGFDQVQRGDFAVRAKLRGHDQLAALISGFNRMVAGLQEGIAERAEREAIERELDVAHDLQRRLLPGLDARFRGFEVAAHFEPAAAVGGDLYQFWEDDDGALCVVVGDVSGHGLATGIVMAASTALVWSQAREASDAAELFRALDRQIRGITEPRTFLTLQHCRLDPAAGRVAVTNAGHPYPFRVSAAGEPSAVENASRPLGVSLPDPGFVTVVAPLEPGDLWCFYSDGMVEAASTGGEPFGFERLRAALGRCRGLAAGAARERLLLEWRAFVGEGEPEDDRTLILVRAQPAAASTPAGDQAAPSAAESPSR